MESDAPKTFRLNGLLLCWLLFLSLNLQAESSFDVDEDFMLCDDEPNVAISLLDVWAGVSSFAEGFSKQSIVTVTKHAWIECGSAAALLLEEFYPTDLCAYDFYDKAWKHWKFRDRLVVTAGPSCCPFSISGKRKRQQDSRSSQGMDTAMLLFIIMENVVNLLDEDRMHGLVTQMDSYLLLHGLVAVGIWRLMCADLGGATGRERVFLRWELLDMASSLPPVSDGPCSAQRSSVLQFCQPLSEVDHLLVRGQSEYHPFDTYTQYDDCASQVGYINSGCVEMRNHGCWVKQSVCLETTDRGGFWRRMQRL
jgi:hypothetical protein